MRLVSIVPALVIINFLQRIQRNSNSFQKKMIIFQMEKSQQGDFIFFITSFLQNSEWGSSINNTLLKLKVLTLYQPGRLEQVTLVCREHSKVYDLAQAPTF